MGHANPEQGHSFGIVGGPDQDRFILQGNMLRMTNPPVTNVPLNITIQVTDSAGASLTQVRAASPDHGDLGPLEGQNFPFLSSILHRILNFEF